MLSLERMLPFVTCSSHTDKPSCLVSWCMPCVCGVISQTSVHSYFPLSFRESRSLRCRVYCFPLTMQVDFMNWQTQCSRRVSSHWIDACGIAGWRKTNEETLSVEKEEPLCDRHFFFPAMLSEYWVEVIICGVHAGDCPEPRQIASRHVFFSSRSNHLKLLSMYPISQCSIGGGSAPSWSGVGIFHATWWNRWELHADAGSAFLQWLGMNYKKGSRLLPWVKANQRRTTFFWHAYCYGPRNLRHKNVWVALNAVAERRHTAAQLWVVNTLWSDFPNRPMGLCEASV